MQFMLALNLKYFSCLSLPNVRIIGLSHHNTAFPSPSCNTMHLRQLDVVVYISNFGIWEVKARESEVKRPALTTQ